MRRRLLVLLLKRIERGKQRGLQRGVQVGRVEQLRGERLGAPARLACVVRALGSASGRFLAVSIAGAPFPVWVLLEVGFLHLTRELRVFLLRVVVERVPLLSEQLTDGAIVLIRVLLLQQRPVAFAEDHKRVHWAPNVHVLLLALLTAFLPFLLHRHGYSTNK